jgi:hypothetical protein
MAHENPTGGIWYVKEWSNKESVICSMVNGKEVHITKPTLNADAEYICECVNRSRGYQ